MLKQFNLSAYPHKFFYRDLDLNLNDISQTLRFEYDRIKNAEMRGVKPVDYDMPNREIFLNSNSISTIKSREYNLFQMYYPFVHDLYSAVVDMVLEACDYYNFNYNSERWMAQAWFNINNKENGGKLDFHDHVSKDHVGSYMCFHGYYCVNAEPSETKYLIDGKEVSNINKNNRAILSLVGFPHAMADWEWLEDRITIAYDIMPLRIYNQQTYLDAEKQGLLDSGGHDKIWEQHWFPLPKIYLGGI